jgi:hypothetical protein
LRLEGAGREEQNETRFATECVDRRLYGVERRPCPHGSACPCESLSCTYEVRRGHRLELPLRGRGRRILVLHKWRFTNHRSFEVRV